MKDASVPMVADLVRRLLANPNDQQAVAEVKSLAGEDPYAAVRLFEELGSQAGNVTVRARWLFEAAVAWAAGMKDPENAARALKRSLDREGGPKLDELKRQLPVFSKKIEIPLRVGQMYLAAGRFAEASMVFIATGHLNPRYPDVYRWLGEVLLRRGDAERAEQILQRGVTLGATGPEITEWLGRAADMKRLLTNRSSASVEDEVASRWPLQPSASGYYTKPTGP